MSDRNHTAARQHEVSGETVGRSLRTKLYDKLRPLLQQSEEVRDSNVRLLLQAGCLDLVSALEEIIELEGLDEQPISLKH